MVSYDLLQIPDFTKILSNETSDVLDVIEYLSALKHPYKIVRYKKDLINDDDKTGLIRSVVLNKNNKVVSVSPRKSIQFEKFLNKYAQPEENIIGEEFVEGTMINLFWDPSIEPSGGWEIATRNTIGGNVLFYRSGQGKTFNQMFFQACKYNNLNVERLDKNYCYSFVLQHPENRIVVPFQYPVLFLIELYKIDQTDKNIVVSVQSLENLHIYGFENSSVKQPEIYEYKSYQDLIDKYASNTTSYEIMGVVFKNVLTGERTKKRNPVYEQIKNLKCDQPKIQYRYLCLRKEGKVAEYLQYFPEHANECNKFRIQLHEFTNTLFSNYKECYIKKQKKLLDYPIQYRSHMFNLHNIYCTQLFSQKLFITHKIVKDYINSLHPSQQMFSLNYHLRKRLLDFEIVEQNI